MLLSLHLFAKAAPERPTWMPSVLVPPHCFWALQQLYVPQRCAGRTCDATKRDLSNATISQEMHRAFVSLQTVLPAPSVLPPDVRIVDIGAGLGMYHIFMQAYYKFHGKHTRHYIFDRSQNGVNMTSGVTHAGFHKSVLKNGTFPFYSYTYYTI